jgi:hypothetical protein
VLVQTEHRDSLDDPTAQDPPVSADVHARCEVPTDG